MQTVTAKRYNEIQTQIWREHWSKAVRENRPPALMPQLAFYVSEKKTGYWTFDDKRSVWGKTKQQSIDNFKTN